MAPARGLKAELLGPPRLGTRAQVFASAFGVLLIASLALSAFSETAAPSAGIPLMFAEILATGLAELLDRTLHRFVVTLRLAGPLAVFALVMLVL